MPPRKSPAGKDPKGLYSTLGIGTDADEAEIRKAYRRLALRWHPDKNPDNPDATAEFQKVSAACEVLSDAQRREMYDTTGCMDAEELDGDGLFRAEDLFAAFFGGGFDEDLDADEQAMMDEFLRMGGKGSFSFKVRGSRKKGRAGRSKAARAAAKVEEQMLNEVFKAAIGGGAMASFEPTCPAGHVLKRKKADGGYECDVCSHDIADGKRFFDCRKCDFSMCSKCHKAAEATAAEEAEEEDEDAEFFEAFCEAHLIPERQGGRLRFRCDLCSACLDTQEKAAEHMAETHAELLEAVAGEFKEQEQTGFGASSAGPLGGLEAMFMAAAMEEMMDGMMGGGNGGNGGMPKGSRRSRKKR